MECDLGPNHLHVWWYTRKRSGSRQWLNCQSQKDGNTYWRMGNGWRRRRRNPINLRTFEKPFVRSASTIAICSPTSAIAGRLNSVARISLRRPIGGMRISSIIVQKNRKIAFEKKLLARKTSEERAKRSWSRSRRRKKWDYYKGIGPKGMFVDSFLPVFILYIFLVFWYGFYHPSRSVPKPSIQFRWFIWTPAHKHHNEMEWKFNFYSSSFSINNFLYSFIFLWLLHRTYRYRPALATPSITIGQDDNMVLISLVHKPFYFNLIPISDCYPLCGGELGGRWSKIEGKFNEITTHLNNSAKMHQLPLYRDQDNSMFYCHL